jgi:hypothetical protein
MEEDSLREMSPEELFRRAQFVLDTTIKIKVKAIQVCAPPSEDYNFIVVLWADPNE